jgi:hypothetical protein
MGHGGGIIKPKLAGAILFALAISICISPLSEGLNNQNLDQNAINSELKNTQLSNANSAVNAEPLAKVNAATTYKKYKYKKVWSKRLHRYVYVKVAYKTTKKTTKKYKYKKVWSSKYHKYVYVKAAYTYKTTVRIVKSGKKGTGDCWTNSEILFNQLKKAGLKVRIIQYPTSMSSRHRSVQIYRSGHWVNYDYKGNGYAMRYWATSGSSHGKVIKTC